MTDTEINEAVARKLGWNLMRGTSPSIGVPPHRSMGVEKIPDYCHSIEAAWEIVKYLRTVDIYEFSLLCHNWRDGSQFWEFKIDDESSEDDTAPMAIALAFLKTQKTLGAIEATAEAK